MIKKIELSSSSHGVFGNPAPLGLIGLAIACAAVTPLSFNLADISTPVLMVNHFKTVAVLILFFGAALQFLTGIMEFANKNSFGGTIFTAFSFLWAKNAWVFWASANGVIPDHSVGLAVDVVLLLIFVVLTYGFGFFSDSLFAFLLDIDLMFACLILKGLTHNASFNTPIAIFTVLMGAIGLWIALGTLINPLAGKQIFKIPGPMFFAPRKAGFDWSLRRNIFETLYNHWKQHAFNEISIDELQIIMAEKNCENLIEPDLYYLWEQGAIKLTFNDKNELKSCRLTSQGIDLYEQLILRKYDLVF